MLALRLVIDTDVLVSAALKPDAVPARLSIREGLRLQLLHDALPALRLGV